MIGQEMKIKRDKKGRFAKSGKPLAVVFAVILVGAGLGFAATKVAEWGAVNRVVKQSVVAQSLKLQLPMRVEKVQPQVIISPIVERVAEDDFNTTEQMIIDRWGYRDGVMAIAIFTCESGLDPFAVSHTGDLGIAQINWRTWKGYAEQKFGWNASDMFDVEKNLDMAYIIWDRGDGQEGNQAGNWEAWTVYTSNKYLSCLE